MLNRVLIVGFFGLLVAPWAFAADVSGIWSGTLTDRNNDPQDVSFRFVQKGETLTGKMYGDNESTPITAAKVAGNQVTFLVTTELNGQITTSEYTGTLDGDQMDFSRVRVEPASAAGAKAKPAAPQTFRVKRLT